MIDSLDSLSEDFDAFIIDQFGVLHDGHQPYPTAVSALESLMSAGKTVIILSNSGKRSHINERRMQTLGFPRSLYTHFVTSGDVAFDIVNSSAIHTGRERCLLIARDGDTSAIDGLELTLTDDAAIADLVIISASESDKYSEHHYRSLLGAAAQRKIPCLCTNPDKLMLTPSGVKFGAGHIAQLFEEMGGLVQWIGKPYQEIYTYARRLLPSVEPQRVLCIGDSLEHDIAGGLNAGFKTLFIRGGIHQNLDQSQLSEAMQHFGVSPHYQMQCLA